MFQRLTVIALAAFITLTCLSGCSPSRKWAAMNREVTKYFNSGQYVEATDVAIKALAYSEKSFGSNHLHVATSLNNLVFLHNLQGNHEKARELLTRALTIKERELGPDNIETAILLVQLSETYRFEGNFGEAENFGKKAVEILQKNLEPFDARLTEAMNNLAFVYDAQNKADQAEALYRQVLIAREEQLGDDSPALQPYLNNLENVYRRQGKINKAIEVSIRSLLLEKEESKNAMRHDYIQSLFNLASLYLASNRAMEAEPMARQALKMHQETLGKLHPRVALDLDLLAQIRIKLGNPEDALPLYRRAHSIQRNALDVEHPHRYKVTSNYIALLQQLGRDKEIPPLEKELEKIEAQLKNE